MPAGATSPRRGRRRWLRRSLIGSAIGTTFVVGGIAAFVAWVYADARVSTVGTLDFTNPLRIPELVQPEPDDDGVVRFDLALERGTTEFVDGVPSETWGVNGPLLGPTLRVDRGTRVEMAVHNGLGEITTMHWHGMHLPAAMDGGPHQPIVLNETWRPTWTVDQPAATLWYHPHPHGATARHVYRGVAGMFILDDPESAALGLPDRYGIDDVPLIVQDRAFDGNGRLTERRNMLSNMGLMGDELIVNGTHDPHLEVSHELVRLRILNGSNARFFAFEFADEREFDLIATDGGLLTRPVGLRRLPLSPGERGEIVVRMTPGERVVLRSVPARIGDGGFMQRFHGLDDHFDVIELRAADELDADRQVPATLVDEAPLDPSDAVEERTFTLAGNRINGDSMDMDRIDAVVRSGSVEVWTVRNADGIPHNFHVHDVQFRVLDVDGRSPPAHLHGRHDTVPVAPGTTVRLAIGFGDHVDDEAPYMFHCHVLTHEDGGMMGQFVVVP